MYNLFTWQQFLFMAPNDIQKKKEKEERDKKQQEDQARKEEERKVNEVKTSWN